MQLNRRDILGGHASEQAHISSAVVAVLPAHRENVEARLQGLPGVEIHHRSASKLVIVLESRTSGDLALRLSDIAGWPGVLAANMVFERTVARIELESE